MPLIDDDGVDVLVVTVVPPPARRLLVAAVFEAAATVFGVHLVDDIVDAPHDGAVLVLLASDARPARVRPGDAWARWGLEAAVRDGLERRGHSASATVWGPSASWHPVIRDAVEHYVGHLRDEAGITARHHAFREAVAGLVDGHRIRTRFQPIVDLASGLVVGFEALSSGPPNHHLEAAVALLDAATEAGLEDELQRELVALARARAAERFDAEEHLLFLNVEPGLLRGGTWRDQDEGWPSGSTVLEVTERHPIPDTRAFMRTIDSARERGVRFALDDVGAGNAGLATLALLAPEFVKIDIDIVRGCDKDHGRRGVIAALVRLSEQTGARVIAEGVETEPVLTTVRDLGVGLGQGYRVASPS